jgi:hypothetical protein
MALRLLGALAIVVLTACSMTVESARFPDVSIECGGAPGLTEGECLDWAEQMLSAAPVNTAKLVLTYQTGNIRCAADYFAADGGMLMTSAARCPAS